MTEEQREALELIKTSTVHGDGTTFRFRGRDISKGVLWAIEKNYAQYNDYGKWEAVNLTRYGVEALQARRVSSAPPEPEEGSKA